MRRPQTVETAAELPVPPVWSFLDRRRMGAERGQRRSVYDHEIDVPKRTEKLQQTLRTSACPCFKKGIWRLLAEHPLKQCSYMR